ncbi:ATP-binding protein [Larkinella bovis]|uniref:ATP-binding protein n=1 Tax=Larkinella bovis TaxID=683041 RepID=A0ABW0IDZ6_9BACT
MTDLEKLIIEKQQQCRHEQVIDAGEIHLFKLLPALRELKDYNIYILGSRIQECLVCRKLLLQEADKKRLKELTNMSKSLMRLYNPSDKITISIGELTKSIVFLNMNEPKASDSAEVSSFKPVEPRFGLSDVILNEATTRSIEEAKIKMVHNKTLYETWGFSKIKPYGKATILNFFGPPGTGKTRTAEALAANLGKPFMDINLADLESKFMSQTSKNINEAFRIATKENALIFFDEADTVLGKRLSTVTQGIDAEINMSRSTMLKELERFEGVCVFATNFESNIDRAFVRRIAYHIPFSFPDMTTLRRLWEYILLVTIPLNEPRTEVIDRLVSESEGLSGSDLATSVELAFPKSVILNREKPVLHLQHLVEAVDFIKQSNRTVGVGNSKTTETVVNSSKAAAIRKVYGGNKNHKN